MRLIEAKQIDTPDQGYEALGHAIIARAVKDLRAMLRKPRKYQFQVHALVKWFHTPWAGQLLGEISPEELLERIYKLAKQRPLPISNGIYRPQKSEMLVTYEGQTMTLKKWAERTGIDRKTLYARLVTNKMPVDKALMTPVRKPKTLYWGAMERTVSEWSEITGIPGATIRERIREGWTTEEALSTPTPKQRKETPQ